MEKYIGTNQEVYSLILTWQSDSQRVRHNVKLKQFCSVKNCCKKSLKVD